MNAGIQFVGVLFVLIQIQLNLVSSGNGTWHIAQTALTLRSLVGGPSPPPVLGNVFIALRTSEVRKIS